MEKLQKEQRQEKEEFAAKRRAGRKRNAALKAESAAEHSRITHRIHLSRGRAERRARNCSLT